MSPPQPVIKLRVGRSQERLIASGHPWLFDRGIVSQSGDGPPGSIAVVYDRQDRFLAAGLYDPRSPIRLRILLVRKPAQIDSDWWRARVEVAVGKRAPIASSGTTGYRLIHGESDGIPALVADRYDTTVVVKVYSAAVLPHLEAIAGALQAERIVLRLSRLLKAENTAFEDGQILRGSIPDAPVVFTEHGLRFEADVLHGQKTGFFLDQRENRLRSGSLARGRSVLNVFSYTGGFSVHAAAGGASSVVSLDLNRLALEAAGRNFALNPSLAGVPHETMQGDAFDSLERLNRQRRRFDLVITDPPSFARNQSQREDAIRAYRRLAVLAAGLVNRRGILVSCSCSSRVSRDDFAAAVESALGGDWRLLEQRGHALDHPIGFPEAEYLKTLYHQRG
ncbi:MAG: class I SAM-dependent methyltransferase [Candidatus Wallbacteria bacterium]|nr:class I SAM-dependent methyltransferase [Candidatus Wallbacteria bacterium]